VRRLVADGETDGHADRFWAIALAVSGAASAYQPYDYRPVPKGGAESDPWGEAEASPRFGGLRGVF
jgi:hypothetical protein